MPHLYYYLDFTVSIFVIYNYKVLLIHHRELNRWLPIGGHIEVGEDPEEAVFREVQQESGLEIELMGEKPPIQWEDVKTLHSPAYLDVHNIKGEHRHVGMIYFARAKSDAAILASREHYALQWFSIEDLETSALDIPQSVRFYGQEAIKRTGPSSDGV